MARRTVLPGILVLKPQASGWCGGRPFPFSRSGAIAPGILRRPRPLKILFVRFLSDDVSLLSKPRAIMARSVLCPVHFLFFVLRAGGHNGVQLCVLREAVNKRDGGVPEVQQPLAGISTGHLGKLMGADPKLLGDILPVALCLREKHKEVRVFKDVLDLRACQKILHVLR